MMRNLDLAGKWLHYAALLALVQLACGCDQRQPANDMATGRVTPARPATAPMPSADTRLIVVFGDSLYAGYNLASDQGLAPTLQRALISRGVKASVFNAGVSGDTSEAGLQRLAFTLDGLPRKPDLIVVGLGGNDMLRGINPDTTRANLDAILAELKKRRMKAMLTGMLAAPNLGPDYAAGFNPVFPDLAKKYGVALYPFFLDGVVGRRDLLLPDGIHPNAHGVERVVRGLEPAVEKALAD